MLSRAAFRLQRNKDCNVVEAFTPDFYLSQFE